MTPASRNGAATLLIVTAAANLVGWASAWAVFGNRPALLGLALLAWVFGLRHGVDADHIAAIDNAVRRLLQDGRSATGVGFCFSLGHSTVVVLASAAIAVVAGNLPRDWNRLRDVGEVVGTTVSATFLLLIAVANLCVLLSVWRRFRAASCEDRPDEQPLETFLTGGGLLARVLGPVLRTVRRSWHMYPVGVLFGLGFDTATEVGVLGIAATQSAAGVPALYILVFPALFTAAMSFIDTADGVLMQGAYSWAFIDPLRRLWYNLTITAASVVVALFIGLLEALALIGGMLRMHGGIWPIIETLNDSMGRMGFLVVGLFVLVWGGSVVAYRRVAASPVQSERHAPGQLTRGVPRSGA